MIFIDQLGFKTELHSTPKRIISVVPSQTELLADLGLEDEVIGITKFCVHPTSWFKNKTRIGGTKKLDLQKIASLQPDLIIANKEENQKSDIDELRKYFPVWISDIKNLDQSINMINSIGEIVDRKMKAAQISGIISERFQNLKFDFIFDCVYLIWNDPIMTIGNDTFIYNMLKHSGFNSLIENQQRYPEITLSKLIELNPRVLLLSTEPFPFKQKHIDFFIEHLPNTSVHLVDGEYFSWYGSRLVNAPAYFSKLRKTIGNAS